MKYFNIYKSILLLLSIVLIFLHIGCTAVSSESTLMKDMEGFKMTATELRIRLNEFGKYFAGTVEEAADEIIENTNNVDVKRNALEWKINVIPRALESLVIIDPVAAGTDIYALCLQMNHFFKVGNGKNLFLENQVLAINASEELLKEIGKVADDFREYEDREEIELLLAVWIVQNPIENLRFNRKSTLDLMAKALGSEEYDLGSTVGSMAEGIQDLRRQITIYTDFLPKHVKWQMEYELYNLMGDSTFEKTFNNIDRVILSTEKISKMIEESPELVKEIQLSTLMEMDKQRLETLEMITQERIALLETVTMERIAIMEQIHIERTESLDRIEEIASKTINQSALLAGDVIDKIFWRVLIILALVFVGGFILLTFYKKKS